MNICSYKPIRIITPNEINTRFSSVFNNLCYLNGGFPKYTSVQKDALVSPIAGTVVYDSTLNKLAVFNGTVWETITSV
jgi:hypothetical protein